MSTVQSELTSPAETAPGPRARGGLLIPCLTVFLSGFCIMMIELVAGGLVRGYIGSSLYTWTAIIGVILGGITIGNYIGGRLADRYDSKRLVMTLFLLAAATSLLIIPVVHLVGTWTSGWAGTDSLWMTRVVTVIAVTFLIPGTAMGAIGPPVAKWALDHGYATGKTVGSIYAWNTFGSILGTFVTGYYLSAYYGATAIVLMAGACLGIVGLLFLPASLRSSSDASTVKAVPLESGPGHRRMAAMFLPCLLVFISGFAVMLIELVASRLTASSIGQSIYTWTSVIGVVLTGITVGNYIGGKMADRFPVKPLVGSLFLVASFFCLSILPGSNFVASASKAWMGSIPWSVRVFLVVSSAYFFAAASLGTISPAIAKWALERGFATGRTVGTIYAWNTLGSIAGTFATGFFLISTFYTSRLIAATSFGLAMIAFLFLVVSGNWTARFLSLGWVVLVGGIGTFAVMPADRFEQALLTVLPVYPDPGVPLEESRDDLKDAQLRRVMLSSMLLGRKYEINALDGFGHLGDSHYYDESNYYTIQVNERMLSPEDQRHVDTDDTEYEPRIVRVLSLDALLHGFFDLRDPSYLHYEYEHIYAVIGNRLLERHSQAKQALRVLFLGGGTYTFPRYLTEIFPDISCTVSEIDPRVTVGVREGIGLNQINGKKVRLVVDSFEEESSAAHEWNGPWPVFVDRRPSWSERLRAIGDAFLPQRDRERILEHWRKRVVLAGGILVDESEATPDFVLHVPSPGAPESAEIAKAKEANLTVIGRKEFEILLEESPYSNIETVVGDARQFVTQEKEEGQFDIIYGDAFNDFSVPAHLTTLEFNQKLSRILKPDGLFMVNVIDVWQFSRFLGSYYNTLQEVFPHVHVFSTTPGRQSSTRMTFVLIASMQPIDLHELGEREGEKLFAGYPIIGPFLQPVIRGGLERLGECEFTSDGKQLDFALPRACHAIGVQVELDKPIDLLDDEYFLVDGRTLRLPRPLELGTKIRVRMFSDKKILLTDDYCPVDNFLSEVIATKIKDT